MSRRSRGQAAERSGGPDAPRNGRHAFRWTAWAGLLMGLTSLGSAAVAVVLPSIIGEYGVSASDASWAVSGYVLMLAVFTAVFAGLGDVLGIRRALTTGIVIMTVGAVVAVTAPTFPLLVAGRLIQGLGAAAVPPLIFALAANLGARAAPGKAVGAVTAMAMGIASIGPALAGQVEELVGWRWVVAVPVLAGVFLLRLWRIVPTTRTNRRLDPVGASLVAVVAAGLLLLAQSPSSSLPLYWAGLPLVALGVPALILRVRRRPDGFLPKALLRDRQSVTAAVAAASVPAVWFSLLVAVPLALASHGWPLWHVGLLLLPPAAGGFLGARASGWLVGRLGAPMTLALACAGSGISAVLGGWGAFGATSTWGPVLLVVAATLIAGTTGIGQTAMIVIVGGRADPDVHGVTIGFAQLVFLLGGAVGAAVAGSLFDVIGPGWTLLALVALPVASILALVRVRTRADERAGAAVTA